MKIARAGLSGLILFTAAACGGGASSDGFAQSGAMATGAAGAGGASGEGGVDEPDMSTTIEPEYGLTTFGGAGDCQPFACGGANSCDSQPWYSASSQRYGCGVHLQVTANGKCVVVETQDAGPASWVESDAGIAILDAGPQVAQYLFGTTSLGWSDIKDHPGEYVVQVTTTSAPLGPCGEIADASTPEEGGKGGGKGGKGGHDAGGGYAFVELAAQARRHGVELAEGQSRTVPFYWHASAGAAPPADLWVEADGYAALQIYSVGETPLARAGLDVVPLEADTPYRVVVSRDDGAVTATLLRADGDVVLRATVREGYPASAPDAVADVVVPGGDFRSCVVSMGL